MRGRRLGRVVEGNAKGYAETGAVEDAQTLAANFAARRLSQFKSGNLEHTSVGGAAPHSPIAVVGIVRGMFFRAREKFANRQ